MSGLVPSRSTESAFGSKPRNRSRAVSAVAAMPCVQSQCIYGRAQKLVLLNIVEQRQVRLLLKGEHLRWTIGAASFADAAFASICSSSLFCLLPRLWIH